MKKKGKKSFGNYWFQGMAFRAWPSGCGIQGVAFLILYESGSGSGSSETPITPRAIYVLKSAKRSNIFGGVYYLFDFDFKIH